MVRDSYWLERQQQQQPDMLYPVCLYTLQVKVWRRHLHKFEDLGLTDAEAHAAELKARVLATRQAKAQAAAEARAAAKRKSKADAAGGKVRTAGKEGHAGRL